MAARTDLVTRAGDGKKQLQVREDQPADCMAGEKAGWGEGREELSLEAVVGGSGKPL